jgi:hypothetical protein
MTRVQIKALLKASMRVLWTGGSQERMSKISFASFGTSELNFAGSSRPGFVNSNSLPKGYGTFEKHR